MRIIKLRNKRYSGTVILGLLMILLPLGLLYYQDNAFKEHITITFNDPSGVKLVGTYYPGTRNLGIILSHGYAGDQMTMKGIVREFLRLGFHVFTYDFEGHGRSSGAMEIFYTTSDRLAREVLAGKEAFKDMSGLDDSEIILFGYSMGARATLQSTFLDENNVKMLILLGCYIILDSSTHPNTQGFINDSKLNWVEALSSTHPKSDILLITGEKDDLSTPYRNELLLQKLGGESQTKFTRKLIVINGLIHPYEPYSPQVLNQIIDWVIERLELNNTPPNQINSMTVRKVAWTLSLLGMYILIMGGLFIRSSSKEKKIGSKFAFYFDQEFSQGVQINNLKKFITWKFILWLLAVPFILGTQIILLLLPLNVHYFPLWGVTSIGIYSIIMILLYLKGKMPGTIGKLQIISKTRENKMNSFKALVLIVFLILISTLLANSGIFYIYPLNDRFIWLIIFTGLIIPGFYIHHLELNSLQNLSDKDHKKKQAVVFIFLEFIPFIMYVAWLASIHGMIILSIVFLGGYLIHKIGKTPVITVLFQAFLINYLLLPQGALYPNIFSSLF